MHNVKISKYANYIFLLRKIVSINIVAIIDIFRSFTFLFGIVADALKIICAGVSSCPKNLDFRVHSARNSPRFRRPYIRASVTHRPDPTQFHDRLRRSWSEPCVVQRTVRLPPVDKFF
jgi:hypothetical protein